jgi:hypothetical protein
MTFLDRVSNLNLSWNRLSGKIPNSIGSTKSMESLDLSRNQISGGIPQSLSDLTYLSYLDLSYNDRVGTIPSGRQLDTLYTENHQCTRETLVFVAVLLKGSVSPEHGSQRGSEKLPNSVFFYYGLGSGFVAGLWVVCFVLCFSTRCGEFHVFALLTSYMTRYMCMWLLLVAG